MRFERPELAEGSPRRGVGVSAWHDSPAHQEVSKTFPRDLRPALEHRKPRNVPTAPRVSLRVRSRSDGAIFGDAMRRGSLVLRESPKSGF
jgi:hypothetical protein